MSEIVFGIDLGTSNTVISYIQNNKSNIFTDGAFTLIPSKIFISPNNKIFCGNYIPMDSTNIIHSFKIDIGTSNIYKRNDKIYTINDILNIFVNHLKLLILKKFNLIKIKTVITVPSNFLDNQREIITSAFINNDFDVIRIINEPSAAALAYGLNRDGESKIMVIDTGGGTMDITILEKDDNLFEVITSVGLNDLGGNNFTQLIVEDILQKYPMIVNNDTLFYSAQRIKEKLSYMDNFQFNLKNMLGYDSYYELTIKKFEKLSLKLLNRIDELITHLITQYENIDFFVLVGSSSKMKILQEKIYDITRKKPWIHPHLESVVSEGASLYGGILTKLYKPENNLFLLDVLPLSLGVETADGNFSVIIPKNTPLPVSRSQKYTTDSPGDNSIKINIYQGERKIANKNSLIGTVEFDKISVGGLPIIDITFSVDSNCLINIYITDKKSGYIKKILIKDMPKYNEDILLNIIKDAEINNESDDEVITKLQRIYMIKIKIENALINLSINTLLSEEKKCEIQNELNTIEDKMNELSNIELLDIIQNLDNKYAGLTQDNNLDNNDNSNDKKMDDLEKVLMNELKGDIIRRATLLLAQNPDWNEFLKPLLEELEITNINTDYLNEKLNILKELQEDDTDRNYKEELTNICIYLKTEIDEGQLDLNNDKKEKLKQLISNNFELLEKNINDNNDINWEEQLNIFNKNCENIYN